MANETLRIAAGGWLAVGQRLADLLPGRVDDDDVASSLHEIAEGLMYAERLEAALMALSRRCDSLRATNWPGLANIIERALADDNG